MDVYKEINYQLSRGKKAVLARIIQRQGSAPLNGGTRCLVISDGSLAGSIGGGVFEYDVINKAREVFETGKSCIH